MGDDGKGCNKWLTYGLGLLALLFLILTIVFGVKMGNKSTKEVVTEVEKQVTVYVDHPLAGDGETSLQHPFYDPFVEEGAKAMLRAGAPALSPEVEAIYSKLTYRQKVGQLIQYAYGDATGPGMDGVPTVDDWAKLARDGEVGSFLNVVIPSLNNVLQKAAVEGTGIPLIMGLDVIHGHRAISPPPLGLAASWDPDMVEKLTVIAAKEAKAEGIRWSFAPMVDVSRDPRWGRMLEGWGEDAYLATIFGPAVVRGFQSQDVAACVKHVAAYGIPTGARDYTGNDFAWVHLHNDYFDGYASAIQAGALTSMASFNTIAGVPAHGNREIINDVQRGIWGFRGMVVSDYGGTREMMDHRFTSENRTEIALKSFFAGIDMNMADGYYRELFDVDPNFTYLNHTMEEYVDLSARRIVYVKEKVGLFKDSGILPYEDNTELWGTVLMSPEARAGVQEAAERSAVLLKNQDKTLPLDPTDTTNKILIVGRMADDYFAHLGSWHAAGSGGSFVGQYIETFLNATDALCGTAHSQPFDARKAANWCIGDPFPEALAVNENEVEPRRLQTATCNVDYLPGYACQLNIDLTKDEPLMKEVENAIATNDYTHIIFVAGENDYQNGEGAVRAHLELPHAQSLLSKRIVEAAAKKATKPKLILVPIIGRPNILTYEDENYDAIMTPWAPGTIGGPAIWNLLRGVVSPGGSITATFPRAMGQIPIYHELPTTGRPYPDEFTEYPPYRGVEDSNEKFKSRYIDEKNKPLYPFGYGLSYADFSVVSHSIGPDTVSIKEDTPINVNFSVARSGAYTGKASKVYQVYVRQMKGRPVPPKKRIRGFARIDFDAGANTASATITLVPSKDLTRFDVQLNKRVEPGTYIIYLAEHAEDDRFQKNITLVA